MLSTALQRAKTGLVTVSEQIDVVSRNVTRRGDTDAVRKTAQVSSAAGGGVRLARIDRASDVALLDAALTASSAASGLKVRSEALSRLQSAIGEVDDERSPAALTGRLRDALQTYASNPADDARARAVISAAAAVAETLNAVAEGVGVQRLEADREIGTAVDRINTRLTELQSVNRKVIVGVAAGADVTDEMDQRDGIIKSLSEDIGLRIVRRDSGDVALYTDSGVTLFDTIARRVEMPTAPVTAGRPGGTVRIDGVPVAGRGQTMALETGRIRELVDFRDKTAETFSAQLDEIARSLISALAETPATGSGLPDVPGLLTAPGATTVFAAGTRVAGLASTIKLNAAYDPAQGGAASRVRDAGSAGPAYHSNSSGLDGDASRITRLIVALTSPHHFDPAADLESDSSVLSFATLSVSWLADHRQSTHEALDFRTAVAARASEALSRETGISLDQEMSRMLDLERSYQASARLLTTIDEMYRVLLGIAT